MRSFLFIVLSLVCASTYAQEGDSTMIHRSLQNRPTQTYGDWVYPKPRLFSFVVEQPKTFARTAQFIFRKESLPAIGIVVASSAILIGFDQHITNGVQQFCSYIGLDGANVSKNAIQLKLGSTPLNVYQVPQNLNSAIYSIGEGMPPILISLGMSIYGKCTNNYRAMSTASQVMQAITAFGITSQVLKRSFGRESPNNSSSNGGTWRPFTNPGTYQKNVSHYDAMPSGHLGTMVATVVVLSDNYPEKKWIKYVGYSLTGLVGVAMINNGVHWAGDYPLAIGLGYAYGKATVKMNRWLNPKRK